MPQMNLSRDSQIYSCLNSLAEFHHLTTVIELDELISEFKKVRKSNGDINSTFQADEIFEQKSKINSLLLWTIF